MKERANKMATGRSDYSERREKRIDHLNNKAHTLAEQSNAAMERSDKLSERFYMGQPIIVGHHSEKSARSAQAKSQAAAFRSLDLDKQAAEVASMAEAAENNSAISSDNPDAPELLKARIEKLEAEQASMKAVNKYFRKHKTCVGCPELTEARAKRLDLGFENRAFMWETAPFASYELTSINQRIKSAKQRLEQLAALDEMPAEIITFEGGEIEVDLDENRVKIRFDERQSVEITDKLKRRGFKWSRNNQCWQRLRNKSALYAAKAICIKSGT
jgi:hypothetical protein